MTDIIVILVIAVFVLLGVKSTIKHFKGEGACCGGGGGSLPPEEKKLENPVIGKKTIRISGMHCEHCVNAVTEAINKIDGASAKVSLHGKKAVVSFDRELDEAVLNRLISKILIGEVKKVDGQKVQEVRIVYNFVGEIPEIAA